MRDETVPHLHPLRPWHAAIVVAAVGVHALALLLAARWMSPAWAVLLATLAALSAAALVRARRPVVAAAVSLAVLVGAFALAAIVVRDSASPLLAPLRSRRVLLYVAGTFGGWLWVLQAPLTLARAWVRLRPAQDAALEVIEPLGYLLVASAAGLALARLSPETAPSVALAGAPGVALLAWAAWRQLARRRWIRRVRGDLDPRWHLTRAAEESGGEPWTHATEGAALPEVLEAREGAEVYRASARRVAVARAGGRDERAWRVRRALHGAAGLWGVAVVYWGAVTLLRAQDPWLDVVDVVRSLHVSVDPCRPEDDPSRALVRGRWGSPYLDHALSGVFTVSPTGRVFMLTRTTSRSRLESTYHCADPALVRDLMAREGVGAEAGQEFVERLFALPEVPMRADGAATCPGGRWSGFDVRVSVDPPLFAVEAPPGSVVSGVNWSGRWQMVCGRDFYAGHIPATEARAVLDAIERHLMASSESEPPYYIDANAGRCDGGHLDVRWDKRAERVHELLTRRLCVAALSGR